ncbi:hypothetical protein ECE50_019160 [Chitinophaga sp. Mgbs1]|uniref:DUF6443 domain-containing protein n=1 Tax=Chitinophaga solisilvae TaxID=1233460 RepID=A0A9Q5GU49_9BACT|nr:hypothetical protein [Chitinophaga solisilvae]
MVVRTWKYWQYAFLIISVLLLHSFPGYCFHVKDTTKGPLNFIRSWSISVPVKDAAAVTRRDNWPDKVRQITSYYDGFERKLQIVNKRYSPSGKDRVDVFQYDSSGRMPLNFMPYVGLVDDGEYKDGWRGEQQVMNMLLYPDQYPYHAKEEFERSPLGRVTKQMKPGPAWGRVGAGVTQQYLLNSAVDSVRIWQINVNGIPVSNAIYDPGELDKKIIADEIGRQIITYTDKQGLVILTKAQVAAVPGKAHMGWNCTYYVYDDFNRCCAIISPLAVTKITSSWNVIPVLKLCDVSRYDALGRVIMSQAPDADSAEVVYDKRNRPVFSRDGNQRVRKEWSVTFYDEYDRIVMTGIYPSASGREQLQTLMNTATSVTSTVSYTTPGIEQLTVANYKPTDKEYKAINSIDLAPGFDTGVEGDLVVFTDPDLKGTTETITVNNTLPGISGYIPLVYNYYDDYSYSGVKPFVQHYVSKLITGNDPNPAPVVVSNLTSTLPTGQKIKVLGSNQWLTSTIYYDEKGRVIQGLTDNHTGGESIVTFQYNYGGRILSSYYHYDNRRSGVTPATDILNVYKYDTVGNVIAVRKVLNNDAKFDRTIAVNTYDNNGDIKEKRIGQKSDGTFFETLTFDRNVQGWLTGISADYISGKNTVDKHFGVELGYDTGFDTPQLDGNLSGMKWKGWNDKTTRKYSFSYDNTSQLTTAAFTQQNLGSTTWTNNNVDYSISNLSYDANGNIQSMKQLGLIGGQKGTIDDLTYTYENNSNKLKHVYDKVNNVASRLGDFKEPAANNAGNISNTVSDYAYDSNGNLVADANKNISTITYNLLDLPEKIIIPGKGTITYLYDATGAKLQKTVLDSTVSPARTIKTDYISGLVFNNDSIQFIPHDEGRIRAVYKANNPVNYVYDYFIRDHLENTRMVLTEQTDFSMYAATMETAAAEKENALFSNIEKTRIAKPAGYPEDQRTGNQNNYVAKLNAASGEKIGPSLVLRVMAGDTINIGVRAFYKSTSTKQTDKPVAPEEMAIALLNSLGGERSADEMHGVTSNVGPINTNFYNNDYQRLKNRDNIPDQPGRIRAYLNYVTFDDQFKLIDENSGVKQVKEEADQLQNLVAEKIVVQKSGFLYVYTSNEAAQDVYFDNLVVAQSTSPVLEETHYYPQGLIMDGISYRAFNAVDSRVLFQGKELQRGEFSDGTGLEWYDFEARYYDPQLGRWFSPDPAQQDWSPYMAMGNRFVTVRDPDGRFWHIVIGAVVGGAMNVFAHWNRTSLQDKIVAFGIGAAAGALGAATGGAAAAGLKLSATTFLGGMVSGAVGGAYSKLVEGTGNMIYFGDKFTAEDFGKAVVQGAALGGAIGTAMGAVNGKVGMDLIGRPEIKIGNNSTSISLSSKGKMIDPVYSSDPSYARTGAGGLGKGGSFTMPEYVDGNHRIPPTTYKMDGGMVFATSGEASGAPLGNIKVNINLNPEGAATRGTSLTRVLNSNGYTTKTASEFFGWGTKTNLTKSISDFTKEELVNNRWTKGKLVELARAYNDQIVKAQLNGAVNPAAVVRRNQAIKLARTF